MLTQCLAEVKCSELADIVFSLLNTFINMPRAGFPLAGEDVEGVLCLRASAPTSLCLLGISPLSWFRGLEDDAVVAERGLDFQRFLTLNRTLLVAAR